MDALVFAEFCDQFCAILRKEKAKQAGRLEIPLLPFQPEPPLNEDDFLTLANEGRYTKAREADV